MAIVPFILATVAFALFAVEGYLRKSLIAWGLAAATAAYIVASVWQGGAVVIN